MSIKGTSTQNEIGSNRNQKVLLGHLPYWDPLIPPMGIAALKRFLHSHGYSVKTFDLNVEQEFKELYNRYFGIFRKYVPKERRGNFYNIGHDILQNHLMAFINHEDEAEYLKLVKMLIDSIFFCDVEAHWVKEHNNIIIEFYKRLKRYFLKLLEQEDPGLLGLTAYKATLPAAMFVFRLAKEKRPDIKTVMGGGIFAETIAVGSPNLEFFLEKTKVYIDKIMIGKGENFLLKTLRGELSESQRVFTMKDFKPGTPEPLPVHIPDLSDFELRHYPYIGASASSGCPFRCRFCNSPVFYGDYCQRDVKQVAADMVDLYKEYNFQLFFMTDALLNPIITDLANELKKTDVALYFDGYFRIDKPTCDIENTLNWRQGGLYRVRLGVESGSQRILDTMGKGITVELTKAAVASLAYAGIKATAYVVIGYPGETEADFQQTLKLMEDIRNDTWQAECVPFAYHYNGQSGSDIWADKRMLLYPETAKDMLITQTWIVNQEPSRKETYKRVFRFTEHCKKLGIPNPYSLNEIYEADERWKRLHKNAVPSLLELMNKDKYIKESRKVQKIHFARNQQQYSGDFGF